jgi:hypothetical protein
MKKSRLAGGLALLLAVVTLVAAAPALAADLPLVSSTTEASALDDGFTCAAAAAGGVVYAAGYTQRNESGTESRSILVKYIDDGTGLTKAWQATGGSTWSATAVDVDRFGNVVVAVNTGRLHDFHGNGGDIRVLKYSPDGELLWVGAYDGPAHGLDYVKAMAVDVHGNVIVCGASFGYRTGRDYVTLKLRALDGKRMWARRYAGPSDFDEARDVTVDPSGNVYITGQSRSLSSKPGLSGPPGAVTIGYSPTGKQRWILVDRRKRYVTGQAIGYTGAGGVKAIVLTGSRAPSRGNQDRTFFAKYRTDGRLLWARSLDPAVYQSGWTMDASLGADGAPVVAGSGNSDGRTTGWLAGVSATGGGPWTSQIASLYDNPSWAEFASVTVSADGRILAAGDIASGEMPETDIPTTYLVRYSPGWPVTAPLDYTGGGSSTTFNACTDTAIGDKGMYAVGKAAEGDNDSDAVLLKF